MKNSVNTLYLIGGLSALLTALFGLAGAAISNANGLGGQSLPLMSLQGLEFIASHKTAYLVREWLFLIVAIFAMGEGLGLYVLLKDKSRMALWALTLWVAGLGIGIFQDGIVIAAVSTFGLASANESTLLVAQLTGHTILVTQFAGNVLCTGLALLLFSILAIRHKALPIWLCAIGLLAAIGAGLLFGLWNVLHPDSASNIFESAFLLLTVWDIGVGVVLVRRSWK